MTDAEFRSLLSSLNLLPKPGGEGDASVQSFVEGLVQRAKRYTSSDIAQAAVHEILVDLITNADTRIHPTPEAYQYLSHRLWQRVQELEECAGSVVKWEDLNQDFWQSMVGPNGVQQIILPSDQSTAYGAASLGLSDPDAIEAYHELSHHERAIVGYYAQELFLEDIADMVGISSDLAEEKIVTALTNLRERYQAKTSASPSSTIIQLPTPSLQVLESWKEIVKAISMDIRIVDTLNWKRFEDLVGHLLESFGWSIQPMGYTKDGGIDLIAVKSNAPDISSTMIVQCKRKDSSPVGINHVRELFAIKAGSVHYHHAMIATSSSFTKGAKAQAALWNLELRDRAAILKWCQTLVKTR